MANVWWTDKAEASVVAIASRIIEQSQSRQRGLDVLSRIEDKCRLYAKLPFQDLHVRTSARDFGAFR